MPDLYEQRESPSFRAFFVALQERTIFFAIFFKNPLHSSWYHGIIHVNKNREMTFLGTPAFMSPPLFIWRGFFYSYQVQQETAYMYTVVIGRTETVYFV